MDDLISRQEIRKAMYHEAMEKDSDEQKWDGGCWIRYKMFERVLEGLPSKQPEPRWIPCSEGLPKAGVRYQVTFESGEVGYADFRNKIFLLDGSAKENVWETERYYEDDGEVIAWMPLPKPYKEGE